MENIEQIYDDFTNILSDEKLKKLAEKHGIVDKRIRRLPVVTFFWLMILSACIPSVRGGLMQLVAFFVASSCQLSPGVKAVSLTRMAISKKLKGGLPQKLYIRTLCLLCSQVQRSPVFYLFISAPFRPMTYF